MDPKRDPRLEHQDPAIAVPSVCRDCEEPKLLGDFLGAGRCLECWKRFVGRKP